MSEQPNSDNSRQDTLRTARKQITRSLLLSLAALGVIVIACYAWFVRNTTVSGALGSISAGGSTFELASVGAIGAFDKITPEEWKVDGTEATYQVENNPLTVYQTGVKNPILWRIAPDSNLGNTSDGNGIYPGTSGDLQFYVIPKRDGSLKLTFDLELLPLDASYQEISGDDTLSKLLSGHLLFSYTFSDQSGMVPYDTNSFSLTIQDARADTPYLVTLHWRWPYVLSDIKNDSTITGWMQKNRDYFFYISQGNLPEFDLENHLKELSDCYNNADQYIGEHIFALLLRLNAQEG